jgi:phosphoribosylanthranilate isomerase
MKTIVKICGITNRDDALFAAELGADALGFIFYRKSPRYIQPDLAAGIIDELPDTVVPVGLFVNTPREEIERIAGQTGIKTIQLHGEEQPVECEHYPIPVWKGVRIAYESELSALNNYRVDAFVFDAATNRAYGGTGITADWRLAAAAARHHTLLLAGGLHPGNVAAAIRTILPYGIDVNSGVEEKPGRKSKRLLAELFKSVPDLDIDDSAYG